MGKRLVNRHTPRPWKVDEVRLGQLVIRSEESRLVAEVSHRSSIDDNDETMANARLMAAAPDLLLACKFGHVQQLTRACAEAYRVSADELEEVGSRDDGVSPARLREIAEMFDDKARLEDLAIARTEGQCDQPSLIDEVHVSSVRRSKDEKRARKSSMLAKLEIALRYARVEDYGRAQRVVEDVLALLQGKVKGE